MSKKRRILLVDDDPGFRAVWRKLLEGEGLEVLEASEPKAAKQVFEQHKPEIVILDLMLPPSGLPREGAELLDTFLNAKPDIKVVVVSGSGEKELALRLVRRGAYDFIDKPVDPDILLAVLERARARLSLENRVARLETELATRPSGNLIGSSPSFLAAKGLLDRAAPTDMPVLLNGASGTGKEVFAQYLHRSSRRRDRPFVAINCGALTPSLLESSLFGHRRGAFTGAVDDAPGLFLEADHGTLFLDEIGDLELPLQVKLLRVIESGEILPVGAHKTIKVDVRIVSATHRPLQTMIESGHFREDLYWRIRGIEIALPSLAERPEDLALLSRHFLDQARAIVHDGHAVSISGEAMRRLEAHDWRGNLRELRHEMQRALLMAGTRNEILEDDLSPSLRPRTSAVDAPLTSKSTLEQKIERLERDEIARAMSETAGNKSRAAEQLGLSRQGFLNKLARYGIDF